jgi:hypothetical protein
VSQHAYAAQAASERERGSPEIRNGQHETRLALKEWAVACEALGRGDQILLLRKGGIREEAREFRVEQPAFLLFPTYEHQRQELLKPGARRKLANVLAERNGADNVELRYWVTVAASFEVTRSEQLSAISPFHLWSDQYALERLRWRPRKPLQVLALRVHRLGLPATLPVLADYGGCKSWLTLAGPVVVDGAQPVLHEAEFTERLGSVRWALGRAS